MSRLILARHILSAFLLMALMSFANTAQAQLGVAAGLNFEDLSDISGDREATFDNANGYHVGVFYDLGAGPIALRVGAFFRDVGDVELTLDGVEDAFDLRMVDVPVDLRFNLTATPIISPYVMVGPVLSFPSSGNDEYDNVLADVSVSGNVGVGLAISLGSLRLYPELRYAIGVSRFMKDNFSIGSVAFEADEMQRQNSVMLRLGIGF